MNNLIEKRKYKRIELDKWKYKEIVSPCITRFRVKQTCVGEMSPLDWNIVAVKNLSAGGIKFNYYKENLSIGSLLELQLDFIKSKPTINCIGRVVRIEDAHINSMFRIAAEFTEINDLDREIINTTVEAILKRETKKRVYSEKQKKVKNTLKRRLERAEAMLEGFNTKTKPSMHLKDKIWTRICTVPQTLTLGEIKTVSGSASTTLRKSDIDAQVKQTEKRLEQKEVDRISALSKIQEEKATDVSNIELALNIIKCEHVGVSGTSKPLYEKAEETSDILEVDRKVVTGKEIYGYNAKSCEVTKEESPVTVFVITYAVLMVILGFLVYWDLTKQIHRLDTKMEVVSSKIAYRKLTKQIHRFETQLEIAGSKVGDSGL